MADPIKGAANPFAQFSPEDQQSIHDQLSKLIVSGSLNPAQRMGATRALLPLKDALGAKALEASQPSLLQRIFPYVQQPSASAPLGERVNAALPLPHLEEAVPEGWDRTRGAVKAATGFFSPQNIGLAAATEGASWGLEALGAVAPAVAKAAPWLHKAALGYFTGQGIKDVGTGVVDASKLEGQALAEEKMGHPDAAAALRKQKREAEGEAIFGGVSTAYFGRHLLTGPAKAGAPTTQQATGAAPQPQTSLGQVMEAARAQAAPAPSAGSPAPTPAHLTPEGEYRIGEAAPTATKPAAQPKAAEPAKVQQKAVEEAAKAPATTAPTEAQVQAQTQRETSQPTPSAAPTWDEWRSKVSKLVQDRGTLKTDERADLKKAAVASRDSYETAFRAHIEGLSPQDRMSLRDRMAAENTGALHSINSAEGMIRDKAEMESGNAQLKQLTAEKDSLWEQAKTLRSAEDKTQKAFDKATDPAQKAELQQTLDGLAETRKQWEEKRKANVEARWLVHERLGNEARTYRGVSVIPAEEAAKRPQDVQEAEGWLKQKIADLRGQTTEPQLTPEEQERQEWSKVGRPAASGAAFEEGLTIKKAPSKLEKLQAFLDSNKGRIVLTEKPGGIQTKAPVYHYNGDDHIAGVEIPGEIKKLTRTNIKAVLGPDSSFRDLEDAQDKLGRHATQLKAEVAERKRLIRMVEQRGGIPKSETPVPQAAGVAAPKAEPQPPTAEPPKAVAAAPEAPKQPPAPPAVTAPDITKMSLGELQDALKQGDAALNERFGPKAFMRLLAEARKRTAAPAVKEPETVSEALGLAKETFNKLPAETREVVAGIGASEVEVRKRGGDSVPKLLERAVQKAGGPIEEQLKRYKTALDLYVEDSKYKDDATYRALQAAIGDLEVDCGV